VAILNGIGLLFYLVPGIVAFAVDFATGAIYLPDARFSVAPQQLQQALDANGEVDLQKLQAILEQHTGQQLPLEQAQQVQPDNLEQLSLLTSLRPAA